MTQWCINLYAACLVWMRRAFAVYIRLVYLFIYFVLLPVCKLARVPPVAWQRAWQWALLTLRPRPRTARALKIDPGRLTLIENKKNARRAERRSRGSTGKKGGMLDGGNDEIWDYYRASSDVIPAERIGRWAQNFLIYGWSDARRRFSISGSGENEQSRVIRAIFRCWWINKLWVVMKKSVNWIVYERMWNAFWLNNERWSNECAALLVFWEMDTIKGWGFWKGNICLFLLWFDFILTPFSLSRLQRESSQS